jgi:protein TonB
VALREGSLPRASAPDDLRLETGVTGLSAMVGRRRSCTGACSVVAHAVGLLATITVPLLLSSALPEPAGTVHAFLVEPLSVPPPAPPPAPAAAAAPVRPRSETGPAPTARFVAPIEVPNGLRPEEGLDLGLEGASGGVEGGVPGGVVGAIVGGLPDAVSAPPPAMPPIRIGSGLVREPSKIRDVSPVYPGAALRARLEASVVVEAEVDERGRVVDATVLAGHPVFNEAALEAVGQWAYTPTLLDGVPVPILLTVTVHFRLVPSGASTGP